MANTPDNFDALYAPPSNSSDGLKKISDVMLERFKGKVMEFYIGDESEKQDYEDYSVPQFCVIYGRLLDVLDRFIIIRCFYVDARTQEVKEGNEVFINAFQIRAMTELNGKGALHDIFMSSKSSDKVRKLLLKQTK